ncbi:hypothetical protein Pmani_024574 [Petrolisthes manimaculis]|uniref:Uncharacterized protein n=1 Tax=Petrolisthes manimaculis TaxID=1843537 RepID=A0AAE1P7B8_9EUCA|nr:hypothetical protein Pmani_024574 [Petrolisthes manimaculis]
MTTEGIFGEHNIIVTKKSPEAANTFGSSDAAPERRSSSFRAKIGWVALRYHSHKQHHWPGITNTLDAGRQ